MAEPSLKDVLNAIAEMRRDMATKKDVSVRFDAVDERLDVVDERFDVVDERLDALTRDVDANQSETRERFDALEKKIDTFPRRGLARSGGYA